MRFLCLVLVLLSAPAWAQPRVLVMGDSVMSFHVWSGENVASVLEEDGEYFVDLEAVPGAQLAHEAIWAPFIGFDIRSQFKPGPWDAVILNGGANDFGMQCGCGACDAVLDKLIDADMHGEIPDLIAQGLGAGAQVIWLGYYRTPKDRAFGTCASYLVRLDARVQAYARAHANVHFVDAGEVISPSRPRDFFEDGVHPSVNGARQIATLLHSTLRKVLAAE